MFHHASLKRVGVPVPCLGDSAQTVQPNLSPTNPSSLPANSSALFLLGGGALISQGSSKAQPEALGCSSVAVLPLGSHLHAGTAAPNLSLRSPEHQSALEKRIGGGGGHFRAPNSPLPGTCSSGKKPLCCLQLYLSSCTVFLTQTVRSVLPDKDDLERLGRWGGGVFFWMKDCCKTWEANGSDSLNNGW